MWLCCEIFLGGKVKENNNYLIRLFSLLTAKIKQERNSTRSKQNFALNKDFAYKQNLLNGFTFSLISKRSGTIEEGIYSDDSDEASMLLITIIQGSLRINFRRGFSVSFQDGETVLIRRGLNKNNIESLELESAMVAQINLVYPDLKSELNYFLRRGFKRELDEIFQSQQTVIVPKTKGIMDNLEYLVKSLFLGSTIFKEKLQILQHLEASLTFLTRYQSRRESVLCRSILIKMNDLIDSGEQMSVSDFSDLFNKSSYQLNHALMKAGYIGMQKTFIELKLVRAAIMLRESDLEINEIATKLCYNNVSKFIKQFKNRYGLTPLQYRKKLDIY